MHCMVNHATFTCALMSLYHPLVHIPYICLFYILTYNPAHISNITLDRVNACTLQYLATTILHKFVHNIHLSWIGLQQEKVGFGVDEKEKDSVEHKSPLSKGRSDWIDRKKEIELFASKLELCD